MGLDRRRLRLLHGLRRRGSDGVLRVVEHPGSAIADDSDRARGAVSRRVLRREERRHPEDEHYDVEAKRPEGHELQSAVRELEVVHGLGFRLLRKLLALVRSEVRHRGATLQVAMAAREDRDDGHRADADRDGRAEDVGANDRHPKEHDRARDGGRDGREEVRLGDLLCRLLGRLLVGEEAEDERRDAADGLDHLLREAEGDEVQSENDDQRHPERAPVRYRREHRGDHPCDREDDGGDREDREGAGERHPRLPGGRTEHRQKRGATEDDPGGQPRELAEVFRGGARLLHDREEAQDDERECREEAEARVPDGVLDFLRTDERARRLEVGEQVQSVDEIEHRRGGRGFRVPFGVAEEDELDDGHELPHEVRGRFAPLGLVGARDAVVALHLAHGFVETPRPIHVLGDGGEHHLEIGVVLHHRVDQAPFAVARLALELRDNVPTGGAFDPHDAEHVHDHEAFAVGESSVRGGLRDCLLHAREGGGGHGRRRGGCGRCGCGCGHGGSDSRVFLELLPVRDDVGTGGFGGLAGHPAQHARGGRNGVDELADQTEHPTAPLQTFGEEDEDRAREVGDAGVEVEEDADEAIQVVGSPEMPGNEFREALIQLLLDSVDGVFFYGIAHGESSLWVAS